jgi:hypothetical protein
MTNFLLIFVILWAALMVADRSHDDNTWALVVKTKGAGDIVFRDGYRSHEACIKQSKLHHNGGYEVTCEPL